MFLFIDRLGATEELECRPGDRVVDILRRACIPAASVIVTQGDAILADSQPTDLDRAYEARLIEGYDIGEIRARIRASYPDPDGLPFVKRRLLPDIAGDIAVEAVATNLDSLADYLIDATVDTVTRFKLLEAGDRLLVGLSGGVDSSALLLALNDARARLPPFELVAVTFEDFDSRDQPTYKHAHALAKHLGIEHHVAPADLVERAFGLTTPLREILPELMATEHAPMVMYVDHHTTRRGLELFAEERGINKVALGLHVTDLLAGILNSMAMGYTIASLPMRRIGKVDYIYPLAFIAKRELHLYHQFKTGKLARHSYPNAWERKPLDRNFYYYLADTLQDYWPGLENLVFSSHNLKLRREQPVQTEVCSNCGSTLVVQPFMLTAGGECDVCKILRQAGFRD
jgi:tRNA(Ile)-lysidine synthase TilS/MesJ